MSTRCTINFVWSEDEIGKVPTAKIYRHMDGYPECVIPDLHSFFNHVLNTTRDTRFNDPSYIAAKFVVWRSAHYAGVTWGEILETAREHMANPNFSPETPFIPSLDFLSIGILSDTDPIDIEYRYWIVPDGKSFPRIFGESIGGSRLPLTEF